MKPFFYLFLFIAFISLSAAILGTVLGFFFFSTASHFFIPGHSLVGGLVSLSGLLAVSIPLLAAFYGITRLIRPYRLNPSFTRGVRYTWIAALFVTAYGVIDTIKDHSSWEKITSVEEYEVDQETITIDIVNPEHYYNTLFNIGDAEFSGNALYADDLMVRVEKAEGPNVIIEKIVGSNGRNESNAIRNAKSVDHDVKIVEGVIKVDSRYVLKKGDKYRGQFLEYRIKVPEGKKVEFDGRAHRYVVKTQFDENVERPRGLQSHSWTMGENGLIAKSWIKENKYSKSFNAKGVNIVNVKGDFEVDISKSSDSEVALVGRQEIVDQIVTVIQDNILTIVDEEGIMDYPVKLYINLPEMNSLTTSSDQKHRIEGFDQESMSILLTGKGDLNAYLDVADLSITAEERPEINLTGIGNKLTLDADYYTVFNGENYEVEELRLKKKMGKAKVKVKKLIRSLTQLSERMKVYGDPEIFTGKEHWKIELKNEIEKVKSLMNEAEQKGASEAVQNESGQEGESEAAQNESDTKGEGEAPPSENSQGGN